MKVASGNPVASNTNFQEKLFADEPKQIAHVIVDDKFIDIAFRQFEEIAPGQNKLLMLGAPSILRYVNSGKVMFCTVETAKEFIHSDRCAAVVFHSLSDCNFSLLGNIPANKKVIWLGWGYDYYDRLLASAFPNGLLLPKTRQLLVEAHRDGKSASIVRSCIRAVKRIFVRPIQIRSELLARVDYFAPVLDVEYSLVKELNPWFKAMYIPWNYCSIEDDLSGECEKVVGERVDILVGNSAAAENNHIEVFDFIKNRFNLDGRKIFVPLSYGDEQYRKKIISAGWNIFGEKFVPILDFLPKKEYIHLVDSCGFVFMNQIRQQAIGNICIMMMKGAKIFMNQKSPAFKWFEKNGAFVESIDALQRNDLVCATALIPLTEKTRENNILFLKNYWGRDVQKEKTRRLIEMLLK